MIDFKDKLKGGSLFDFTIEEIQSWAKSPEDYAQLSRLFLRIGNAGEPDQKVGNILNAEQIEDLMQERH